MLNLTQVFCLPLDPEIGTELLALSTPQGLRYFELTGHECFINRCGKENRR